MFLVSAVVRQAGGEDIIEQDMLPVVVKHANYKAAVPVIFST